MYELRYLPEAEKYFKKIKGKRLKEAFKAALLKISQNPYDGEPKSGD